LNKRKKFRKYSLVQKGGCAEILLVLDVKALSRNLECYSFIYHFQSWRERRSRHLKQQPEQDEAGGEDGFLLKQK